MNGHEPILQKMISSGDQLIRARHFAASDIKDRCEDIKQAWANLLDQSKHRKSKLDFSLQKQSVSVVGNVDIVASVFPVSGSLSRLKEKVSRDHSSTQAA